MSCVFGQQRDLDGRPPRLRVRLWIVDGDADVHVSEILPAESRRHVKRFRRGLAQLIEPYPAVEASAVDDERVALPFRSRVTVPRRCDVWVRHELAAVHERLPPEIERLVNEEDDLRGLHRSATAPAQEGPSARPAAGSSRPVPPSRTCPRHVRRRALFAHGWNGHVFLEIPRGFCRYPVGGFQMPDKSGLPSGSRGAGADKIGLAVRRPRDSRRRDIGPLREGGGRERKDERELKQCSHAGLQSAPTLSRVQLRHSFPQQNVLERLATYLDRRRRQSQAPAVVECVERTRSVPIQFGKDAPLTRCVTACLTSSTE